MGNTEIYKWQAKNLRERLERSGITIPHSLSLEAVAAMYGYKDWNILAAREIKPADVDPGTSGATFMEAVFILDCIFEGTVNGEEESVECQYAVRARDEDQAVDLMTKDFHLARSRNMTPLKIERVSVDLIYRIDISESVGGFFNLNLNPHRFPASYPLPFREQKEVSVGPYISPSLSADEFFEDEGPALIFTVEPEEKEESLNE